MGSLFEEGGLREDWLPWHMFDRARPSTGEGTQKCHLYGLIDSQAEWLANQCCPYLSLHLSVCVSVRASVCLCVCRQGTLKVGDRILKINGVDVRHSTHAEALGLLRACHSQLTLEIEFDVTVHGMGVGI